ncbi:hypothetical protein DPMN_006604 [Dreissena polymorpha]|uniref:Uncharacterized protein n=1 Tax=Dreissena polymorpha TaxID=45954 RepID=A0A9D4RXJ2_DREPO|nr:hypothetical protein DPMN_006604 [Dreissena polymorpha]
MSYLLGWQVRHYELLVGGGQCGTMSYLLGRQCGTMSYLLGAAVRHYELLVGGNSAAL